CDKAKQIRFADVSAQDDARLRDLAGFRVGAGNDREIAHRWVRQQQGPQLRRGNLVALVFDQLFDAVHDVQVALVVDPRDVAGVEPAVRVQRGGRGPGLTQVTAPQ